jgi:chitinase
MDTPDALPTLSINDVSVSEGQSGFKDMSFIVSVSAVQTYDVSFTAQANNDTALYGQDYEAYRWGEFTIPAGQSSINVDVDIVGDTVAEPDETLFVNLTGSTFATIADAQGVGTISNDDVGALSISDASVVEGDTGSKEMTFTISSSQVLPHSVQFYISFGGYYLAQRGVDYDGMDLILEIPAGQQSVTYAASVFGDTLDEEDEQFFALISQATCAIADAQGIGTIIDNDAPTLSIEPAPGVTEGDSGTKVLTYTVRLSKAATYPVTYDVATSPTQLTATEGVDYVASSLVGETIPAGQTSKVFSVSVNGDTAIEPTESVRVRLSNGSLAITTSLVLGTIINDDFASLSIADAGFLEGDSGTKILNFVVTLSQASAFPVNFTLQTVAGTATPGSGDYVTRNPTALSIPAGQLTRNFSVTVNADLAIEGNETFFVWLTGANTAVTDAQAKATIVNDDGSVLRISDATISEGNSGTKQMAFTIYLSQPAGAPVYVYASTYIGTANGSDFWGSGANLTIPAGQTSKVYYVTVTGDTQPESNEYMRLLISGSNVSIVDGVGIGTITNDD